MNTDLAAAAAAADITGEPSTVSPVTGGWIVTGPHGRAAVHDIDMAVIPIGTQVPEQAITVGFSARGAVLATDWSALP